MKRIILTVISSIITSIIFNNYNAFDVGFIFKTLLFMGIAYVCSKKEMKDHWTINIISALESLFIVLGKQIATVGYTSIVMLLQVIFVYPYFKAVNNTLFNYLGCDTIQHILRVKRLPDSLKMALDSILGKTLIIFLGHCLFLSILYPGLLFVDTSIALKQHANHIKLLHYSPIYTSILTILLSKLDLTDKVGVIFPITLLNILIESFIYALAIHRIRYKVKNQLFLTLMIALSFVLGIFGLTICKDTIFVALLSLITADIFVYLDTGKIKTSYLSLELLFATILRNNLVYVLIVFVIIAFKYLKKLRQVFIVAIVLFFVYTGVLTNILGYRSDGLQETISVPAQQIIRTYTNYPEDFNTDDKELMEKTFTKIALTYYLPQCSDIAKERINTDVIQKHSSDWLKLYLKQFLKHPTVYFDATLANTYYLYYPESIVNIYNNEQFIRYELFYNLNIPLEEINLEETYAEEYKNFKKYKNFIDIKTYVETDMEYLQNKKSYMLLFNLLNKVGYEKIPVLSMLFSFGNMFWLFLTVFFLSIYRKDKPMIITFGFLLIYFISILFGPCILLRYIYILWVLLPIEILYLTKRKGIS